MYEDILLSSNLLSGSLPDNLRALLHQQKDSWALLRDTYERFEAIETKEIALGESVVRVQHNPARLASTSAKVEEESIRNRPCFLCRANLPPEQRAVKYTEDFVILCNPYPIFPEHFTIAYRRHMPQRIDAAWDTLVGLSKDLEGEFVVLYNGPRCGASAPDHLHLQAGGTGFLPLEEDYERMIAGGGTKLADSGGTLVFAVEHDARRFLAIESDESSEVLRFCRMLFDVLRENSREAGEPMMNILSWYESGEWRVIVFPRARHRPSCYFDEDERKLLVSPAAIDLAGVLIAPRAEDFQRVGKETVIGIYDEVLMAADDFHELQRQLRIRFLTIV